MQMGVEWIACHGKNACYPRYFLDPNRYWFVPWAASAVAWPPARGYCHQAGRIYLLLSLGNLCLSELDPVTVSPHI